MDNNELQHWGVRGMRWGVRRYQNKDGTLTTAGKKRYEKELAKAKEQARLVKNREQTKAKLDKLEALKADTASRKAALDEAEGKTKKEKAPKEKVPKEKPLVKRSIKDLSDDELAAVVRRMQLEKQLESMNPKKISSGKQFVESALKPAINDAGKRLITDFAVKQGKKFLGLNEKSNDLESIVKDLRLKKEHKELSDFLSPKSDSKVASDDLESLVKDLRNEKTRRQLEDWLDEDNKKRKK